MVGNEAGVERVVGNIGGKSCQFAMAAGGEVTAARQPIVVGRAVRVQDDAAVVDDGVLCEGDTDAAVGIVVARGGRDDGGMRRPVSEQGLLQRRGVGNGAAVAQIGDRKIRLAGRCFARAAEQRVVKVGKKEDFHVSWMRLAPSAAAVARKAAFAGCSWQMWMC